MLQCVSKQIEKFSISVLCRRRITNKMNCLEFETTFFLDKFKNWLKMSPNWCSAMFIAFWLCANSFWSQISITIFLVVYHYSMNGILQPATTEIVTLNFESVFSSVILAKIPMYSFSVRPCFNLLTARNWCKCTLWWCMYFGVSSSNSITTSFRVGETFTLWPAFFSVPYNLWSDYQTLFPQKLAFWPFFFFISSSQ